MLALASALAACDDDKYWCEDAGNCIAASDCSSRGLIAYKIRKTCDKKYIPIEATGFKRGDDGVSACPDGSYTVLNETFIWCVSTEEDCKDYYVAKSDKFCVRTIALCRAFNYRPYNWTGQNECIADCYKRGGFGHGNYCVTSVDCHNFGLQAVMTGGANGCNNITVQDDSTFDKKWLDVGVYKCTGKLFDLRDGVAKCIPTNSCNDILYSYYQQCVETCPEYLFVDKGQKYCIGPWGAKNKQYCYTAFKNCSFMKPDTDSGGFVDCYKDENRYACIPTHILLINKTDAKCIEKEKCTRKQNVTVGQVCYERVCPEDLAYDEKQMLCVEDCGSRMKYRPGGETLCQDACTSDAPYVFDGWCKKRCPAGSFVIPGNFTCEAPTPSPLVWKRVPALPGVSFLERFPRSYSQVNVTVEEEEGHFAAFLEVPFSVTSLRLLAFVSSPRATYMSALVWGGVVLSTEIQLTGKVKSAFVLAERLVRDVAIVRCFFFVNIGENREGTLVGKTDGHTLTVRKSRVDLGTGVIPEYLT